MPRSVRRQIARAKAMGLTPMMGESELEILLLFAGGYKDLSRQCKATT